MNIEYTYLGNVEITVCNSSASYIIMLILYLRMNYESSLLTLKGFDSMEDFANLTSFRKKQILRPLESTVIKQITHLLVFDKYEWVVRIK